MAFEYYDEFNRDRVQNIKEKMSTQKHNLNDVKEVLEVVKMKILKNEEVFKKANMLKD